MAGRSHVQASEMPLVTLTLTRILAQKSNGSSLPCPIINHQSSIIVCPGCSLTTYLPNTEAHNLGPTSYDIIHEVSQVPHPSYMYLLRMGNSLPRTYLQTSMALKYSQNVLRCLVRSQVYCYCSCFVLFCCIREDLEPALKISRTLPHDMWVNPPGSLPHAILDYQTRLIIVRLPIWLLIYAVQPVRSVSSSIEYHQLPNHPCNTA